MTQPTIGVWWDRAARGERLAVLLNLRARFGTEVSAEDALASWATLAPELRELLASHVRVQEWMRYLLAENFPTE